MAEGYLLDSNIASYLINGRSQAARQAFALARTAHSVEISCITEAELLFGLRNKLLSSQRRSAYLTFRQTVVVRSWDSAAAEAYSSLLPAMRAVGKSLATMDLLIAAHAAALGAILVTNDKAFEQIGDMVPTVNWATDLN